MTEILTFKVIVNATPEEVYAYHEKAEVINRLAPPWEKIGVLRKPSGLQVGGVIYIQKMHQDWLLKHVRCDKPDSFEDEQVIGPFSSFKHKHYFKKISETQTEITDQLEYCFSKGLFMGIFPKSFFTKRVKQVFAYRYKMYEEDFKQFSLSKRKPLKILVTGSHGFIGEHVCRVLSMFGDEVYKLVRISPKDSQEIYWDPIAKKIDSSALEGFDVVIHLGGESITTPWTKQGKKRIYESRINSTKFLVNILNQLKSPPKTFLCASGCGFYGHRFNQELDESFPKGSGFLSNVVEAWEKSANEFKKGRVVLMRFGVVLGGKKGILQKLFMPFKMGLGVIMGRGIQWMSWISVDDLAYQILHILKQESIQGAINFTSPNPVTAKEFSKTLGFILKRPVLLVFPAWLIKMLLGRQGEELLLMSTKAIPKKLVDSGSVFSYSKLSEALKVYLVK